MHPEAPPPLGTSVKPKRVESARPPSIPHPLYQKFLQDLHSTPKIKKSKAKGIAAKAAKKVLDKAQENNLYARLLVICLAVFLLWTTNLAFTQYLVEELFLIRPSMETVGNTLQKTFDFIEEEKSRYNQCASYSLGVCDTKYASEKEIEQNRTKGIDKANAAKLELNEAYRREAVEQVNETLNELTTLVNDGNLVLADYQVNSSVACARVEAWVKGQTSASDAMGVFDQFTANTTEILRTREEQLEARAAYDEEYLKNKTIQLEALKAKFKQAMDNPESILEEVNKTMNNLRACFKDSGTYAGETCNAERGSLVSNTATTVSIYENRFLDYKTEFDIYYAGTESMIDDIKAFGDTINAINDALASVGVPGIEYSDPNSPSEEALVLQTTIFGDCSGNPCWQGAGIDENGLLNFFGFVGDGLNDQSDFLGQSADSAKLESDDLLDGTFSDYNPPNITTDEVIAEWEAEQEKNRDKMDIVLDGYKAPDDTKSDDFIEPVPTSQALPENPDDLINSTPERILDFFLYEDSIFQTLQINLQTFSSYAILFDIIYRCLYTIFLIRKYWNLSSIGKPPGDARIHLVSGGKFGLKETFDQKIARWITHPFVLIITAVVFLTLIYLAFWSLYEGVYNEYVEGCVQTPGVDYIRGTNKHNGTMIYQNALVLALQHAYSTGDKSITEGASRLNTNRDAECREFSFITTQEFNNKAALNYALLEDYRSSFQFNDEIKTCLDIEQIDLNFSTTFVEQTNSSIWNIQFEEILSSIYNCSNVGSCPIECGGPNLDLLQREVYTSACVFEWWFHGGLMGNIMIVVTFILINISRIEFVNAIVRIWWRHLAPNEFSFYGSCEEDGTIIYPESVTEEGMYFKDAIAQAVHHRIKDWERSAWLYLAYAVGLNVPWLFLLITLSEDLTFTDF